MVTCKIKCCAKVLAAIDNHRKIILLQQVKKMFLKLFLEKWAWPPVNHTLLCLSLCHRDISIKILRILLASVGNITNLLAPKPISWLIRVSTAFL